MFRRPSRKIFTAGSCATGTHGSGDRNAGLAAAAAAIEIVRADGEIEWIDRATPGGVLEGAVVALGAASNFVAIMANGGYMPAALDALQAHGKVTSTVYSNSVVAQNPALAPLTDIFALPAWLPFANVFSVGDVPGLGG